jgi:hypothetical protein
MLLQIATSVPSWKPAERWNYESVAIFYTSAETKDKKKKKTPSVSR